MSSHQTVPNHATLLGPGVLHARRGSLGVDTLGPQSWIALALAILATIAFNPTAESGGWLWLIALFVVGMPHGGYDLEAIRRTTSAGTWAETVRPFAIYSLIMLACVVVLAVAPTAALIAFLILTIHHFGHSDSVWTRYQVRPRLIDRLPAWGHGSVAIASPFLFQPDAAWLPFKTIATTIGAQSSLSPESRQLVAGIMLAFACISLGFGIIRLLSAYRYADAIRQCVVLGLTLILAALAPPLVTVGVYFLAVHAAGHCLTASTPPRSNATTASLTNLCRVHSRSIPLLFPTIVIVIALSTLFKQEPSIINRIAFAFILFCSAATLPHHMLWAGSKIFR